MNRDFKLKLLFTISLILSFSLIVSTAFSIRKNIKLREECVEKCGTSLYIGLAYDGNKTLIICKENSDYKVIKFSKE